MNKPQIFNHPMFGDIRAVEVDEKPYFVGIDVARALEYSKPSQAVIDHCKGIRKLGIPSEGGTQETNIIPEGDVWRLIVKAADQSRNPEIKAKAEKFEQWIFDEVLPSIRQHGGYLTPAKIEEVLLNPDTIIDLAQRLKQANEEKAKLAAQIEADRPKVLFAEALETSGNSILIGELAKILKQNGINIGQNRLFECLRQEGYLMKTKDERWNDPTQKAMELGLFEIKKRTINSPDGSVRTVKTTKVTPKGQIYFVNKFKAGMAG
jgi:phage antirepressor YoqD-like protein